MKVQGSRQLFKVILFITPKNYQKEEKQTSSAVLAQASISKSNPLLFCCPLFFTEYVNPQVWVNRMVNEHSLTISLQSFSEFCFKNVYPTMLRNIFKVVVFRLLENILCGSKNWKQIILLMSTNEKFSCRFFSSNFRHRETTRFLSLRSTFLKNLFPFLTERGVGRKLQMFYKINDRFINWFRK